MTLTGPLGAALVAALLLTWALWPAYLEHRDTKRRNAARRQRICEQHGRHIARMRGDQ